MALCLVLLNVSCGPSAVFEPVAGFSDRTNREIERFLKKTATEKGRKIAVFDGDGTVIGQAPHYLADECLYRAALDNPGKKPDIVRRMRPLSNVSVEYVQLRVLFFEGDTVRSVEDLGDECFNRYYKDIIFAPMRDLIALLRKNGFEVWIVSASPEAMYRPFLSRAFGIPETNVIGVKSVVRGGRITGTIVPPVPQDGGKMEAVETFIQESPLFAAGNSRGDREMIESSRGIRMIINPDEHVEKGETESIAAYARRSGWLVERIPDVPPAGFPAVSSKKFGIRINKTNR
ncbi:MAG TPA: haloacid dehalogenase-like hydrolase [Spirochaetota bacterium]|nr:haloacid dehalogenase-like hydrolase [Spirochaetota bacterium]